MTIKSEGNYTLTPSIVLYNITKAIVSLNFGNIQLGQGFYNFSITNSNNITNIFSRSISYECIPIPYPLDITPLNNGEAYMTKDDLLNSMVLFRLNNWREDYILQSLSYSCNNGMRCTNYQQVVNRNLPNNILGIVPELLPPYQYNSDRFNLSIQDYGGRITLTEFTMPQFVPENPLATYENFECYPRNSVISTSRYSCHMNVMNSTGLIFMTSQIDPYNTIKRQTVYGTPDNYTMLSYHRFSGHTSDSLYFLSIAPNITRQISPMGTAYCNETYYNIPGYSTYDSLPFLNFPNDTTGPNLVSIEIIPWGTNTALVRAHIIDNGSGFSTSNFGLNSSMLVSGNITDGYYDTLFDYTTFKLVSQQLALYDFGSYSTYIPYYYYQNTNLQKTPVFPGVGEANAMFGLKNFTSFFYKYNNVDTTNGPTNNTLYFGLTNPDPELLTILIVLYHYVDSQIVSNNAPIFGKWNEETQLYSLDFTLRGRIFSGSAFTIMLVVDKTSFFGSEFPLYFPETGDLLVTSEYADEFPPIVIAWEAISGTNITLTNLNDTVEIGFKLTIEDLYNGFKWGDLIIAGLIDPGQLYIFTLEDSVSGTDIIGNYTFSLKLNGYCKSDTYAIRQIGTVDKGLWRGNSTDFSFIHPLQRFIDVDYPTITVNCPAGDALADINAPYLLDLQVEPSTIDVGSLNRTLTITFKAQDNETGINYRRVPSVRLLTVDGQQLLESLAILISEPNVFNNATYQFTTEIPYGFGYPYGIYYQIEGIFDNNLNYLSLSNANIETLGYQNVINVEFSQTPWINGHEPISTNGGDLTIYGRSFATGSSRVVNVKYGSQSYKKVPVKFLSNVAMILTNVPGSLSVFYVQVVKENTLKSNEYPITPFYIPTSPPTSTGTPPNLCDEDKTCGGNGQCTLSGCVCNSPWVGKYCGSRVIIIPVTPSPNVTEPSFQNNINGTGPNGDEINFSTLVNIISIRELSPNQTVVYEYKFNQWIYTNITDDFGEQFLYESNFTKDGVKTDISIIVEWFKSETTIVFANQNLTINPSTMKYKINVSPFKFSSKLNSFQIIMAASILSSSDSSDSCSAKEFGETSDPNYQYSKLQIDNLSLYGKFIKLGVVDGRVVQIENVLIDPTTNPTSDTTTQAQSLIGITVPNFKKYLELDPDFSVLLDTTSASDEDNSLYCKTSITDLTNVTPGYKYINNIYAEKLDGCSSRVYFILIEDDYDLVNMTIKSEGNYTVQFSYYIRNGTQYLGSLEFNTIPLGQGYFNFTIVNSNNYSTTFDNVLSYECLTIPYPLDITPMNDGKAVMSKDDLLYSMALFKINNLRVDYLLPFLYSDITCDGGMLCIYIGGLYGSTTPTNILSVIPELLPPYQYTSNTFNITIKDTYGNPSITQFSMPQIVPENPYTVYQDFECYPRNATITTERFSCQMNIQNGTSLVFLTSNTDPYNTVKRQIVYGTPSNYTVMSYHRFSYMSSETMYFVAISPNDTIVVSPQANAYYSGDVQYYIPYYKAYDNMPFISFSNDSTSPNLMSIEFIPWGTMRTIIKVHIKDVNGSGFAKSEILGLTSGYLTSGNVTDGTYEILFDYGVLSLDSAPAITFSDYGFGSVPLQYTLYINTLLQQSPYFPGLGDIQTVSLENFTTFYFKYNDIDTTKGPIKNTVYFGLTHPDPTIPFIFIPLFHYADAADPKWIPGKWNEDLQLYSADFVLRGRLFTDIGLIFMMVVGRSQFLGTQFAALFPKTGELRVTSNFADEYPPIVTAWESISGTNVTLTNLNDIIEIGFKLTIEDLYNGFDWGILLIAGIYDPGVTFNFSSKDAVSGTDVIGNYTFSMRFTGYCKSDTYAIRQIKTVDKGLWEGDSESFHDVNPLQKFFDTNYPIITVNCPAGDALADTIKPNILDIQVTPSVVDVGSLNRTLTITFQSQDNETGINYRILPTVNLLSVNGYEKVSGLSKLISEPNVFNNATYQFTTEVPYGFGYPYGIFYQIEGMFDNSLNYLTLNNADIKSKGYQNVINVEYSMVPWINGHEPISTNGGELTIYGRSFATGSSRVVNLKSGSQTYKKVPVKYITNVAMILSNVPGSLDVFYVQIVRDNTMKSNEYPITPFFLPTQEPSPTFTTTGIPENLCDEDKTCGGNGQCTLTGCVCNSPWVGKYCGSRVIIIPVTPSPNVTEPSFQNNINGTDPNGDEINFSTLVNIISIRELSPNQTVVFEYKFNQWIYTNITDDFGEQFLYDSNFTKDGVTTNISIIVEWFKSETTVVFANQNLTINPSTMKYKIDVSPFKFSSNLNSFQIIMAASILSSSDSSDSCSAKEFGETSDPNYQYVKLQIDDHSLYGKFIKLGVVDGRVIKIENVLIDPTSNPTSDTTTQAQSLIGITVPIFRQNLRLDPDFSVLLDTSPASEDTSALCQSTDKGLSKSQLAGIIVGSIGFAAAAAAMIGYYIYRRKQDMTFKKSVQSREVSVN
ncbi:EGF-like domain-containing protein [Tieghemostelium lacteum]|uniref:EGF-like domain-containing protein n=1 Tax=Tieghemostelium lacteum TaxID=361077 RepID=A0A151Z5L0_TIELA|nr:EGF-like domain-containing protein [Tieghemostelium lacteum]|eukprot:KYQ89253.1 EGF-like domain-containing protein [Tieghemostelium lacteum]